MEFITFFIKSYSIRISDPRISISRLNGDSLISQ